MALVPLIGAAQARKLSPVDEGPRDPSFKAFRDRLLKAVKEEDETVLYESLDPKITNSFGGEGGVRRVQRDLEDGRGAHQAVG